MSETILKKSLPEELIRSFDGQRHSAMDVAGVPEGLVVDGENEYVVLNSKNFVLPLKLIPSSENNRILSALLTRLNKEYGSDIVPVVFMDLTPDNTGRIPGFSWGCILKSFLAFEPSELLKVISETKDIQTKEILRDTYVVATGKLNYSYS